MHIAHADAVFGQIFRQILRHLLCQRRDKRALALVRRGVDLADQIVDLSLDGAHKDLRVEQARGADDLLGNLPGTAALILGRCRRNIDCLMDAFCEFVEGQWSVIIGRRQAEAVVNKTFLARVIAVIHGAHLRQRYMTLIDEEDEIVREIVQQRRRRGAGGTAGNDAGIILDAGAEADLLQHFQIVLRPLADALRLEQLVVLLKKAHLLPHLSFNILHGAGHFFSGRDIMRRRVDGDVVQNALRHAGDGVDLGNAVNFIAEKLDADGSACPIGGINLQRIAAHAVGVADEVEVVALVADLGQLAHKFIPVVFHAGAKRNNHVFIVDRIAQTVDARHGRDDNHVPALGQRTRRAVAQTLDLVVDGGILFDVGIRLGNICLRLVIVIVGNEVFHGVFRKKLAELRAQLRSQRLVVRQDQRGPIHVGDDIRHGERLAGTGHAEQDLIAQAHVEALRQLLDGLRLVAGGLELGVQLKVHTDPPECRRRAERQNRRPRQ